MEYGMSTRRYLKIRLIFNFIWKDYISRPRYTLRYLIIVHVRLLNKLTLRRHNSFSIALTGS